MSAVLAKPPEAALPRCPLCAGWAEHRLTMPIDAKTFRPTSHGAIHECEACSLRFVHPRPTAAETGAFYQLGAYYTQGASHMVEVAERGLLSRLREHLAWLMDRGVALSAVMSQELPGASAIVDIGCGGGQLLRQLAQRGHHAVGVERDASSVSRRNPDVQVLEGSAEALPAQLARGAWDGVVFSHVLEHLVDPLAAVREAATLLKPSGLMFCEVPNNESSIARQSGLSWEHLDVPRHINFFTESSLVALARGAGLEVQRVYFAGYCRFFADSYIATEQRIYDQLAALPGGAHDAIRNSRARAWRLLARTALASARRKYDSVGIVARRAPAGD